MKHLRAPLLLLRDFLAALDSSELPDAVFSGCASDGASTSVRASGALLVVLQNSAAFNLPLKMPRRVGLTLRLSSEPVSQGAGWKI